ncbi:ribonuclease HII [Cryomorpha ignava]|uniref:Ribonuclease HII n=1 Tax=Cryomorpha ignava TaxID=101383 RepID=A0A7K3WRI9_9FLAO|nr:ribonuclease HII [Cryomorpha ignava]NEN24094.1 ribonuclease HII [Cryomorpha ignava]
MARLKSYFKRGLCEAGCDEAGRGCLAGPVVAAAVILPKGWNHPLLNDSKLITENNRDILRQAIEKDFEHWAVGFVSQTEIDEINILNAAFLAMHRALDQLAIKPELILVDGNRFNPYGEIKHECIVKGDSKMRSIAAASVLAKTYRDAYMVNLHTDFPHYNWLKNKGYPTKAHRAAIMEHGSCNHHRMSFTLIKKEALLQ